MTETFKTSGLKILILFIPILLCCKGHQTKKEMLTDSLKMKDSVVDANAYSDFRNSPVHAKFLEGKSVKSHICLDFAKADNFPDDTSEMVIIKKECAIYVQPDTTWQDEQIKTMSEEGWNTVAMDNITYNQAAIDTLKLHKIEIETALRDKRYVKFIKSPGTEYVIDLKKMIDAWGLILFNGTDNPVLWSSTDIDQELNEIFKK